MWNDLLSKKIPKIELSLAKSKLKGSYLHSHRTCEDITFRKIRLLDLGMDPFYDEKVEEHLKAITSETILNVSKKHLSTPCLSITGNKEQCKNLKEIWKKKY
tara:strand:+ start:82 stop:387 length:306 start_codon:yes stop_codon:yes gene_type:complete